MTKKRVLFFAEAVTLAHVARPIALAKALAGSPYEPVIACDERYEKMVRAEVDQYLPLSSIGSAAFLAALAKGSPVYDLATLRSYVVADLALIDKVNPDLIVGDFRLSLSVSARLAGIPYAALTNAYWSPYYRDAGFPLPVLPMTRVLPLNAARRLFRLAQPLAFALHCQPLNRLRQENSLPSLGNNLRRIYTDADHTLYADDPVLFPLDAAPPTHHRLGPVLWSPPMAEPAEWDRIDQSKATVYLTLGSSGAPAVAKTVFEAIETLGINLIAAAAGNTFPGSRKPQTFASQYVPGEAAAKRAHLVVCNGGSPTSQQALAAGVPVLGIAGNMDQFLNMDAIVRAGLGRMLRADRLSITLLQATIREMLGDAAQRTMARQYCAVSFDTLPRRLSSALDAICATGAAAVDRSIV